MLVAISKFRNSGTRRTYIDEPHFFSCTWASVSSPAEGLSSRSRLRGTQGGSVYTTAQVWAPAGLRGPCSWTSKSRELASNHGIAFRRARANQAHGKPQSVIFSGFHLSAAGSEALPRQPSKSLAATVHQPRFKLFALTATNGVSACG